MSTWAMQRGDALVGMPASVALSADTAPVPPPNETGMGMLVFARVLDEHRAAPVTLTQSQSDAPGLPQTAVARPSPAATLSSPELVCPPGHRSQPEDDDLILRDALTPSRVPTAAVLLAGLVAGCGHGGAESRTHQTILPWQRSVWTRDHRAVRVAIVRGLNERIASARMRPAGVHLVLTVRGSITDGIVGAEAIVDCAEIVIPPSLRRLPFVDGARGGHDRDSVSLASELDLRNAHCHRIRAR